MGQVRLFSGTLMTHSVSFLSILQADICAADPSSNRPLFTDVTRVGIALLFGSQFYVLGGDYVMTLVVSMWPFLILRCKEKVRICVTALSDLGAVKAGACLCRPTS